MFDEIGHHSTRFGEHEPYHSPPVLAVEWKVEYKYTCMLTEDYIIRMINLAIAALLRIIGLRKSGAYEEALGWIDLTFEQLLGLRASMVKNLDDDRLYFLLTRNNQVDFRRLELVADLFREEAHIFAEQNRAEESLTGYARAIKYYLDVWFDGSAEDPQGLRGKIEETLQSLQYNQLQASTLWALAGYLEEDGAFAQAEAALLVLASQPETKEAIEPELVSFYERMLEKPVEDLERGGLKPADVKAKLEQSRHR